MIFPTTLGPKNIFEVLRYFVFHRGGWGHQKSPTFSPWQSPKLEHLTHPPPPPRAVWESPDPMGGGWESTPLTTLSRISGGAHFWVKSFSLHPRRRRRFLCAGAVAGGGQPPFPHQAILYSPAPAPPPYLPATSAHHPPIVTLVLGGGGTGGGGASPSSPSAGAGAQPYRVSPPPVARCPGRPPTTRNGACVGSLSGHLAQVLMKVLSREPSKRNTTKRRGR